MSLLDYSHPDIVYGRNMEVLYAFQDGTDEIVVVGSRHGLPFALRVHAARENWSHVMSQTYYVWACTHLREGKRCGYAPGHEDMPPLPGQHCHNCHGLRAEQLDTAYNVRREQNQKK